VFPLALIVSRGIRDALSVSFGLLILGSWYVQRVVDSLVGRMGTRAGQTLYDSTSFDRSGFLGGSGADRLELAAAAAAAGPG